MIGFAQGHHDDQDRHQDKRQDRQQDRQDHRQDRGDQRHEDHGQPQRGHDDYRQSPGRDDRYHSDNGRHLGQQKQYERAEQDRIWQQRRAGHWENEHRGWAARGGYRGYRVPDDYFRGHFGHDHFFRVYGLPFGYEGGNPRFQYGGRWFTVMDPYPEYWGPTWYQTDDVFVDYRGDGYYLFNRRYSGRPGIAININF
jgi:hypothetical protein